MRSSSSSPVGGFSTFLVVAIAEDNGYIVS
jgi:hypothetical protein